MAPPQAAPYRNERAVLATGHGKLECIGPPLEELGLVVAVIDVDTDVLGTFTGEDPRTSSPLETATATARLGMAATGVPLGLASEGSFGPHPAVPWVTVDREIVVLVDDRGGLVVAGVASSTDIVAASMTLGPSQDFDVVLSCRAPGNGAAAEQVRAETDSCPACHHRAERVVVPEGTVADPGTRPRCNP